MKKSVFTLSLIFSAILTVFGQGNADFIQGRVSFISSQNIYCKFESMEGISAGDTLFILSDSIFKPAIRVDIVSSLSCVGVSIDSMVFNISDSVFSRKKIVGEKKKSELIVIAKDTIINRDTLSNIEKPDSDQKLKPKQVINGRIVVSSYSNFSNLSPSDFSKLRYTLSISGKNLGNTGLSAECYISFNHSKDNWAEIKDNIYNGLKIYDLSLKYAFNPTTSISAGRKINPKISSLGAIDGLQFESGLKSFSFGAVAGFCPDHFDYSFNPNLFQYGVYLGHHHEAKNGISQSTLAYFDQKNKSFTDRRFMYFQHSNSLVKNLYAFFSAEVDLYQLIDSVAQNSFDLTGIYFSLNYRPTKKLSLSASYDQRKNIVYYETFKSYLEYLIESESRKGFGFGLNYRIAGSVRLGLRTIYRFRASDPIHTKNLIAYLTFSKVPWIKASSTITSNFLSTSYLKGMILGVSLSKDFIKGKLNAEIRYRYFNGLYAMSDVKLVQNIGELSLNYEVIKRITLSANYELILEDIGIYNRVYLSFIKRF